MTDNQSANANQLITTPRSGLGRKSASLLARGLRELTDLDTGGHSIGVDCVDFRSAYIREDGVPVLLPADVRTDALRESNQFPLEFIREEVSNIQQSIGRIFCASLSVPATTQQSDRDILAASLSPLGIRRVEVIDRAIAVALCYILGKEGLWFLQIADAQTLLVCTLDETRAEVVVVRFDKTENGIALSCRQSTSINIEVDEHRFDRLGHRLQQLFSADNSLFSDVDAIVGSLPPPYLPTIQNAIARSVGIPRLPVIGISDIPIVFGTAYHAAIVGVLRGRP